MTAGGGDGGTPPTGSVWNPEQYGRFRDERSRPFFDLLSLARPAPEMRVVDLGCGTGELTRDMHRILGARETLGLDSSDTMLAKSVAFAGRGIRFEKGDIRDFRAHGEYDLVFSNAALQWVPDHEPLLQQLTGALRAGGQFAIQVPANHDYPSHAIAAQVAAEPRFREAMGGYVRPQPVLEPEQYAVLLHRLGFREQHVRLQVYPHVLPSREEVVEWVKGTWLTAYQERMSADIFQRYLEVYRDRLFTVLEDTRPFFYPFKRILLWAQR